MVESEQVPLLIQSEINKKLDDLKEVRGNVMAALSEVSDNLVAIGCFISQHLRSETNPDGVFLQEEAVYLDCLKVKVEELDKVFSQDKTSWNA